MTQLSKLFRSLNRLARCVMDTVGDDQQITGVLVQMLIGICKEGKRGRVPHDLINTNDLRLEIVRIGEVSDPDKKNSPAGDRAWINGAVKRNRNSRLRVEAIELIQKRDIKTIGWMRGAIRQRQVDAQMGVLPGIPHGEAVAGKGRLRVGSQVK